jgi:hypothetical protein
VYCSSCISFWRGAPAVGRRFRGEEARFGFIESGMKP